MGLRAICAELPFRRCELNVRCAQCASLSASFAPCYTEFDTEPAGYLRAILLTTNFVDVVSRH